MPPLIALLIAPAMILAMFGSPVVALGILLASTLLGAASLLPGGANLPPAQVLIACVAFNFLRRPALVSGALQSLAPFNRGFWLALTVGYAALGAIVLPRLFAGVVDVFAIGSTPTGVGISLTPLGPVHANITQSLYFLSDLLCFLIFASVSSLRIDALSLARAFLACSFINLAFAAIDLTTFWTNTSFLMAPIRNASYTMWTGVELDGLKRIVGSFSEASAFAFVTVELFALSFKFWLEGIHKTASGLCALGSAAAIVLCTSSTGYIGLAAVLGVEIMSGLVNLFRGRATIRAGVLLALLPFLFATLILLFLVVSPLRTFALSLADITLFGKLDSSSGLERSAWNAQALVAFDATRGLGAGVGSIRASSWPIVALASLGVAGSLAYAIFILSVLLSHCRYGAEGALARALKLGCIGGIATACASAGGVDLGSLFFAMAGTLAGLTLGCSRDDAPLRQQGPAPYTHVHPIVS